MIQRIQSVYLLLASLLILSPLFLPLATAEGDATAMAATGENFFADGAYRMNELKGGFSYYLLAGLLVFAIFLYKNRPQQMRIALGAIVVILLFGGLCFAFGYRYAEQLPQGITTHIAPGSIAPLVAIPLLLLAYRAIRADENLVRSSDRLR